MSSAGVSRNRLLESDPVDAGRDEESREDLHRSQRVMIIVRWIGVPWALLQTLSYSALPYPEGAKASALILIGTLAVGNGILHVTHHRPQAVPRARAIAIAGLLLDIFVLSGFVWLFAFDPSSALWAILFILPLEGAISFQLRGAIGAWAAVTLIYMFREIWGSDRYGYLLEWNSITFRMGIGGIIATVAGLMARDLVRQRAQLREALLELKRIDRLRLGLVSTLGHDVRSPLTVIRATIATLLKKRDQIAPEDAERLLASSDRQARRLEALANDLLDLARLEEGRLDIQIDDVELVPAIEQTIAFLDTQGDITVDIKKGVSVKADPQRLDQIIFNLLSNALRHGEPPVEISAQLNGEHVKIKVSDEGSGVPQAEQPHLFEPFRVEKHSGSVGYGLAIVKALTEAMDGEIGYQDREPTGACFWLTLPPASEGGAQETGANLAVK